MTNLSRYNSVGIGLDTLFNRLDALELSTAKSYPPYNIIEVEEGVHVLEIALAGFSREAIEVITERNVLTVSAKRETDTRTYTHRGLAYRSFSRNWQLADNVEVEGVTYVDGLLSVTLRRVLPEAQQRKVLEIN
jgi:molecular chaperone IbpA